MAGLQSILSLNGRQNRLEDEFERKRRQTGGGAWASFSNERARDREVAGIANPRFRRERVSVFSTMQLPGEAGKASNKAKLASPLIEAFSAVCDRWGLGLEERSILLGLGNDIPTAKMVLERQIGVQLRDMRDRIGYVIGISFGLGDLLDENENEEKAWMNTPFVRLEELTPLQFLMRGGFAELLRLHNFIQYLKSPR